MDNDSYKNKIHCRVVTLGKVTIIEIAYILMLRNACIWYYTFPDCVETGYSLETLCGQLKVKYLIVKTLIFIIFVCWLRFIIRENIVMNS